MDTDDIVRRTPANRRRAADLLDGLAPEQWATPSLCAGWTVRVLAGHMLMPMEASIPGFLLTLVRARGSADRAVDLISRKLAQRAPAEIVATLRAKADAGIQPPGVGALGPMADGCIHLTRRRAPARARRHGAPGRLADRARLPRRPSARGEGSCRRAG